LFYTKSVTKLGDLTVHSYLIVPASSVYEASHFFTFIDDFVSGLAGQGSFLRGVSFRNGFSTVNFVVLFSH
jgi:hypothetical protein